MKLAASPGRGGVVAIFGMAGSGKTSLAARYAARALARGVPVSVYDPTGDVSAAIPRFAEPGRPVRSWHHLRDAAAAGREAVASRSRILIIDEAEHVFGDAIPEKGLISSYEQARNFGRVLILTSRAPQSVSIRVRRVAAGTGIFRMLEETAVKAACQLVGPVRIENQVYSLARGRYIWANQWREDPWSGLPIFDNLSNAIPWEELP